MFRIACPAITDRHTERSHWTVDNSTLSDSTARNYNSDVTLTCEDGFWLHDWSSVGKPNTTQTVKCGLTGDWTSARDCSTISMNFCENCLASSHVVKHPLNIRKTFIASSFITSTIVWLFCNIVLTIRQNI